MTSYLTIARDARGEIEVKGSVVRWFGGTLLGAGGLVRAYGDAKRLALDAGAPVPRARDRVRRLPRPRLCRAGRERVGERRVDAR